MIHSKNHNNQGFTLIEIMFALFMVATVLSSILNLQDVVFTSVVNSSRRLQRMFMIKEYLFNRLFDEEQSDKTQETITREKPLTTLDYQEKKVAEKSSLAKLPNMISLTVTASWISSGNNKTYSMKKFVYKSKEETKDAS